MDECNVIIDELKPTVLYICGICGSDVELRPTDPVRCRECGYRVLYKKRIKNYIYEAR
ncbi:DNA-directed RNA polymerases I, II, and III subunit rpabc4-like [Teleopsis dalmanni]|uniref:DNA-directed RNA polymerases I, II, and III subunit rpabc4-like n=1 Tax=Teleopsis dalmanni TaxID=139649 RepID=UPI0018CE9D80|nr:DNA-directed RNA polymerases I, II, and III subunit rpabc4-like [Teleopsis dalmanni]